MINSKELKEQSKEYIDNTINHLLTKLETGIVNWAKRGSLHYCVDFDYSILIRKEIFKVLNDSGYSISYDDKKHKLTIKWEN